MTVVFYMISYWLVFGLFGLLDIFILGFGRKVSCRKFLHILNSVFNNKEMEHPFMKKDRLVAGGIAGIVGSITCDILGFIYKSLGWADRAFYENSTILLTNQIYSDEGISGLILSIISHIAVCLIFGVLFAYIILLTTSNYLYIKGLGYGLVLWMLLHGFGTIFNLPLFTKMPLNVAYATLSMALVYGLTISLTLKIIEKKTQLL